LKIEKLKTNYLPVIDLNGSVSWQNDVPHFNSPVPGFDMPMAPKDQYKASVDVQQMIYDGGITKASKEVERLSGVTAAKSTEVELYSIRGNVIESYYLILIIEQQIRQLELAVEQFEKRIDEVKSAQENGVALKSSSAVFKIEILKLKQKISGLEEARVTAFEILEELVGEPIPVTSIVEVPITTLPSESDTTLMRPELFLFDAQKQQLDATIKLSSRKRIPKLFGFGQAGYGNPGYNVLMDEFADFYMVGLKLNWNIYDWNKTGREKDILAKQKELVDVRQESFIKQIRIKEDEIQGRIRKFRKYISSDEEILTLQKSITETSLSKLHNGTITAADYVDDLNAQLYAAFALEIHKLELNKAMSEYENLLGRSL
jgi:outer membrane protein TolC